MTRLLIHLLFGYGQGPRPVGPVGQGLDFTVVHLNGHPPPQVPPLIQVPTITVHVDDSGGSCSPWLPGRQR